MEYETVIGLEVHAQLLTKTKLFCGCASTFGDPPNVHVCPVCLGLPGSLPVLNRRAVEMALRVGIAVGCSIAGRSVFARKNYFYPDLPKGYQISQYDRPLCGPGSLTVTVGGTRKTIGIARIHLEEDAGKLIHDQDVDSLLDVNRCGTPLVEIVSEPDMRSPAEAYAYVGELKLLLEYLDVCDCNMEQGSLRCDANVSVRRRGDTKLGTRTEIKNMNSFRGLERALSYEAERQRKVLEQGGTVVQQTFLWDPSARRSVAMRSKEDAPDYRYFPEPDLPPLVVGSGMVESVRATLPELPASRRERFAQQYGLAPDPVEVLTSTRQLADYFEETLKYSPDARLTANWIMVDVLRITREYKADIGGIRITPRRLGALLRLVSDGTVSATTGRRVMDLVQELDRDPDSIVDERGLAQVSDARSLEAAVRRVIESNPAEAERYRRGEKKLLGFFVGQAMKATGGKGNPKEIHALFTNLLG